jgi:hypothetical protein
MNKIILGILLGGILGIFDGATAWFTPEVRNAMLGIIIGSTVKGMIAGFVAGWFARKVHNVGAGIAVGLAVGALLAFGVCQLQGGKYYFEIMLPGSIVGAIVGWATQRYGVDTRTRAAASLAMLFLVAGTLHAHGADAPAPVTAGAAFKMLSSLAGTWNGHILTPDGPAGTIVYRLSAGGTTVMETLFPDSPHEMITMYTVDGDDLMASHFCSGGNQPTMRLDRARSTADNLVFEFVSVKGVHAHDQSHIHDGWIHVTDTDTLEAGWGSADHGGKSDGAPHRFFLSRAK